jgi:hypothetical protein
VAAEREALMSAAKVFYPVFPPDRSAAEVIAWLRAPD